ncbi:hypothetical protein KIW84_013007 [Lathyrus oleraceus]|uniref:Uncharacterized protein n=1 Tax=Pisum sativum TaxID=3888 RepID=A0A9D5BJ05_PEA|nr:hypothetical protein KIW84_013007 [Pisum sativum]
MKVKQPGPVTRLLSCTDEKKKNYKGMHLAPIFEVPSVSRHPKTGDWYPAINKPAGVIHWFKYSKDAINLMVLLHCYLLFVWKPYTGFLSISAMLGIIMVVEALCAGGFMSLFIGYIHQYNSLNSHPDVLKSLYSPLRPASSLEGLRYPDCRLSDQQKVLQITLCQLEKSPNSSRSVLPTPVKRKAKTSTTNSWGGDGDSKSVFNKNSETNRRHSIAISPEKEDVSSPAKVAKTKSKVPSTPAKKQLSFPASGTRRHPVPSRIGMSSNKNGVAATTIPEEKVKEGQCSQLSFCWMLWKECNHT